MTHLEALLKASYATGARDQLDPDVSLIVCGACTQALLLALAQMFPKGPHGDMKTLEGSRIFGCTQQDGPPDQCALHTYLQEDVANV